MVAPKRKTVKKTTSKSTKSTIKTSSAKSPASVKIPDVTLDRIVLKDALLLFAFHESEKANYLIRMAQSGANVNPEAAAQRISGLKTYYNARLDAMKNIYISASSSSAKTKSIAPEIDNALTPYYTANTNSKVPEGYSWPSTIV